MTARSKAQSDMLARLRDKGLGLAPVVKGGRIVAPRAAGRVVDVAGVLGPSVAVQTLERPITREAPPRPAEGHIGLLPDPVPLVLATEFEIDMTRFEDWQAGRISANDRYGHREKAKRTKRWRKAGKLAAAGWPSGPLPWARLVVWYRFPDNVRRETSNLQPTSKAIVDGLVDAGVLADDRDEMADGPDNRRVWPNGPHRVVVQVWTPS